jgi:thiamine pyrophosphate-dependent acetolactate synthase large subunit-like protein
VNADVKSIRVHPVHEDIGRNWPIDLGVVSNERPFMEALAEALPRRKRDAWVDELATARQNYLKKIHEEYERGLKHSRSTDHLHPAVIGKEVHDFLYKGDIDPKQTVTGWGGWTIGTYVGRWLRAYRPAQGITCGYQFGAIGPDLAMMVGAGAAVQRGVGPQSPYKGAPVLCVTSDASTAYSLFELETAQKYQIPVITVVYNNNCWGTWPQATSSARSMHMYYFHENLRYDQIAQALGGHGEYVHTPEEFREALGRSYQLASREKVSSVINCQALKEFTSAREYPPGLYIKPEPGCGAFAH